MTRIFEASSTDATLPIEVLSALASHAEALGREWVVVGAAARDLVVHAPLGLSPTRSTTDIDIAIYVGVQADFDQFTHGMPPVKAGVHTFRVHGQDVDIVPYGGIEVNGTVQFADDHVLDVVGLAEAAADPDIVRFLGQVDIPVAPAEIQVALKVLAWRDRRHDTGKDAIDLWTLLAAASQGCYADEAWNDDEALEMCGYAIQLAGPYRFGRDAARRFTRHRAQSVLDVARSGKLPELARDMKGVGAAPQLDAYLLGFERGLDRATP